MSYTPPKYPAAIPTEIDLPNRVDNLDYYSAARYNELKKEMRAIMIELGVLPKGAYADVTARLTALAQAVIPAGLIAIWHGLIANIPTGWVICDGNNATPNLLDKFVKSVPTAVTNPGTTGGSATVTLSTSQIPAHTHTISSDGNHQHTLPSTEDEGGGVVANQGPTAVGTISTNETGAHTHGAATGSNGDGGSHENRPPYYEIAFIMKT
jgi:microcystin-dependent protein